MSKHSHAFRLLNGRRRMVDLEIEDLGYGQRRITIVDMEEPDTHIMYELELTERWNADLVIKLLSDNNLHDQIP